MSTYSARQTAAYYNTNCKKQFGQAAIANLLLGAEEKENLSQEQIDGVWINRRGE
jgi:hypothetical protein